MTFDLSTIPWSDIDPHGLLVARLSGERLDQFVYTLRDKMGDSVKVIPMAADTEVLCVAEAEMNLMGWFRR